MAFGKYKVLLDFTVFLNKIVTIMCHYEVKNTKLVTSNKPKSTLGTDKKICTDSFIYLRFPAYAPHLSIGEKKIFLEKNCKCLITQLHNNCFPTGFVTVLEKSYCNSFSQYFINKSFLPVNEAIFEYYTY